MNKRHLIVLFIMVVIILLFGHNNPVRADGVKAQLILDSYVILDDCQLGEENKIRLIFKNTNADYDIKNVLITCSSNSNTIIPVEGKSNQLFIESISAKKTAEIEVPFIIIRSENGYASMNFTVEYMSDDSRWSSSSYIVFSVAEKNDTSVILKNVSVPNEAIANSNSLISISFLNSSDKDMFNTVFWIEGEMNGGFVSKSLGTVPVKRNAYGELFVSFSSEGEKDITLLLRYDDENGETHEETIGQYVVKVKEVTPEVTQVPSIDNSAEESDNDSLNIKISVSTLLLIVSGTIFGVIGIVLIVNVIRKRNDSYDNPDGK